MLRLTKRAAVLSGAVVLWQLLFVLDALAAVSDGNDFSYYTETENESVWNVDYRVRRLINSNTSFQFGMPNGAWTPLSKLDWSLDSTWHGLRVETARSGQIFHFEWLTPIGNQIDGNMIDSDWTDAPGLTLDSQTSSSQRWNDGQMLDLGTRYQWCTKAVEIWPMLGVRFQRFDMFASGIDYLVPNFGPDPAYENVDVIKFNQQYYQFYLGGQLRKEVTFLERPVTLICQGDWAATWGYNIDHHLVRAGGDRYTMENTQGNTIHFACGAETPLRGRFSFGLQFDYMQIRTTGSHRMLWQSHNFDETWHNGVLNKSNQTSLTAYLRASF